MRDLAYVFWHGLSPGLDPAEHERVMSDYHRALAANRPFGFQESATFRVSDMPWLPGGGYEDWYLVAGFAELGTLNDAAASGAMSAAHASAARGAGKMAAGLYRRHSGHVALVDAGTATWITKPAGTSYASFYESLSPLLHEPGTSLWRRQLVLAPATEFCLLSREPVELDPGLNPLRIDRVRVA